MSASPAASPRRLRSRSPSSIPSSARSSSPIGAACRAIGTSRRGVGERALAAEDTVKNLKELRTRFGGSPHRRLSPDIERDQRERATMSILIPPQMLNTMNERDL